ncbi:MAG: hypothetical protein KGJ66_03055 [Alphaproteobacteria bacterium]|nr:hypothetical protein [Alphaproteobacteria bacterium]
MTASAFDWHQALAMFLGAGGAAAVYLRFPPTNPLYAVVNRAFVVFVLASGGLAWWLSIDWGVALALAWTATATLLLLATWLLPDRSERPTIRATVAALAVFIGGLALRLF